MHTQYSAKPWVKEMDKIMETLGNRGIKLFALDTLKEH